MYEGGYMGVGLGQKKDIDNLHQARMPLITFCKQIAFHNLSISLKLNK